MSIINHFLSVVTEPQFKLARDLTAMAIADGKVTPEEKEAMSALCQLENINETTLMESLQGGFDEAEARIPKERKEKELYLKNLIKLIGADKYAAPQEIYLFQIVAGRMGLNQMDVMGIFLASTTHQYFKGDAGIAIFTSFLKNHIAPKSKTEKENRDNIRAIYETVAINTERLQDPEADRELLLQNLERATRTFMENSILIKEFRDMKLDLGRILKEEELRVFMKYY